MPRPLLRRWAFVAAGALLPWAWLALRALGGALEAVAVALPLVVAIALVAVLASAAALRRPALLVVAASLVAFGLVTILGPRLPRTGPPPADSFRLASANVFSGNPTPAAAVHELLAAGADVEVAVETDPAFRRVLTEADRDHPSTAQDDQLVVRSRYPVTALPDPPGLPARRILRVSIDAPSGPFVLYAVHALNPLSESTFADQLEWVDRLRASASQEDVPVVLAGDFNMSDRQLGYRRMTSEHVDAITAAGWGHTTYPHGLWGPLLLRIDHVFMPQAWCSADARTFDVPGSDHDGVAVVLGPCP